MSTEPLHVILINLISGPRNISTALMYSFAQRSDTVVLDEPFYAVYFLRSNAVHPGREEVIKHLPNTEEEVTTNIFGQSDKPVVFVKNMAHHIEVLDESFLDDMVNIFLIRNPKQIIASYAQVIDKPNMRDIGIEFQYNLFERLRKKNQTPLIIDSNNVLENPEAVLKKVCEKVGLQFQPSMLHWPAGPKPYDGVWAKYWYANVHQSTGFEKQPTSNRELPAHLQDLYEQSRIYYEKLLPFALRP